jgi:GAF domain-containing protein
MPTEPEEKPGDAQEHPQLPVPMASDPPAPAVGSRSVPARPIGPTTPARASGLPVWRRVGLAGGGTVLVVGVIATHAAAPIAIPAILIGGLLYAVGLGFERPLKAINLTKGGVSAQSDEVKEAVAIAEDASDLTRRRLGVVRDWMEKLERMISLVAQPEVQDPDAAVQIADFVRSRLADLTQELKTPGETIRASAWLFTKPDQKLRFALGSDIKNPHKEFSPGEGIIGRAFLQQDTWNVDDGPARTEYAQADPEEPFRGLLCIPLRKGATSLGVLCVDRTKAEKFSASAVDMASLLASIIVLALSDPRSAR